MAVWTHIAGVYGPGEILAVYVNGISFGSVDAGALTTIINSGVEARIGARGDSTEAFTGSVDDVRVYDRALSAAEIAALFAAP